jgi:hypothetical protein
MGFMSFESEIGIGKMLKKSNSWILNLELMYQWFDQQMICHGFDQQLLFINLHTFESMTRNEICEFFILELQNLEFRCPK